MFRLRVRRPWFAAAALAFGVALVATACAEESPVIEDAGVPAALAATTTTTTSTTATTTTTTTVAPTVPPETTMAHDDEMAHDEEMEHGDDMGHEGDDAEPAEDEAADFDREIEVVMTEFAFEPATISVTAGETVRFVLINQGAVPHEFRLTTAHAAAEHVASGHAGHGEEGEGGHGHDEALLEVPAGATDHLTVTFAEDADWDHIACLIPGHYEAGMLGELQIS